MAPSREISTLSAYISHKYWTQWRMFSLSFQQHRSFLALVTGPTSRSAFLERRLVRAARKQADSCNIKNRFRNSVQPQVLLDQRVPQCSRAEGSKSQPRRREAKRLTEMARLEQNNAIRSSSTVLPHRSREDRCHDEKRCRLRKIRLIRAICTRDARRCSAREPCQAIVLGLVVIDSPLEPLYSERYHIYLSRVPSTAGRA